MTHIVREMDRVGSKSHKKEVVEPVTIVETPPMMAVGIIGYTKTPRGLRPLTTVWAAHIGEACRRRFYKHFAKSKKKAFTKHSKKAETDDGKKALEDNLARMSKYCHVIRVIAHTQTDKLNLRLKKAHIMEIQVGSVSLLPIPCPHSLAYIPPCLPLVCLLAQALLKKAFGRYVARTMLLARLPDTWLVLEPRPRSAAWYAPFSVVA